MSQRLAVAAKVRAKEVPHSLLSNRVLVSPGYVTGSQERDRRELRVHAPGPHTLPCQASALGPRESPAHSLGAVGVDGVEQRLQLLLVEDAVREEQLELLQRQLPIICGQEGSPRV